MDNLGRLDESTQPGYSVSMTQEQITRMAGIDRELRDLIAHEGIASLAVAELMTEQEALLALWLAEAEARHQTHLGDRR
jgi:hypothetical protein